MDYSAVLKDYDIDVTAILGSIFNSNFPYVVVLKDLNHRITYVNNRFYYKHNQFLTDPMSVLGKTDFDLFGDSDHARQAMADEKNIINTGEALNIIEIEGKDHNGNPIVAHTRKYPMKNTKGDIVGLFVITEDITYDLLVFKENTKMNDTLSKLNQELSLQNYNDALSGLFNRKFIRAKLDSLQEAYSQTSKVYSMVLIDIDYFKEINDDYGHAIGDEVITYIGDSLKEISDKCEQMVYPCRFGGDEFMFICEFEEDKAINLAYTLHQYFKNHPFTSQNKIYATTISASIGVASIKEDETVHSLLNRCDQRLYKSKRTGKNKITYND